VREGAVGGGPPQQVWLCSAFEFRDLCTSSAAAPSPRVCGALAAAQTLGVPWLLRPHRLLNSNFDGSCADLKNAIKKLDKLLRRVRVRAALSGGPRLQQLMKDDLLQASALW